MALVIGGALAAGGSILASSLASRGGGRTPGFGSTNIDEIQEIMRQIGFGSYYPDSGGRSQYPAPRGVPSNFIQFLQNTSARDLPTLDYLQNFIGQTGNVGLQELQRLSGMGQENTRNSIAAAGRVAPTALNELNGVYDPLRQSVQRDLPRQIQGIFREEDARAARNGVKSRATAQRGSARASRAAESVQDVLAQISAQEGQQRAGIAERGAQGVANVTGQRAGAQEAIQSLIAQNHPALRGQYVQGIEQLLGARRTLEQTPYTSALNIASSFPQYQGTSQPRANFGDQLAGGLNSLSGLFGGLYGLQQQQQQQGQVQQLLQQLMGGNTNHFGPMGP